VRKPICTIMPIPNAAITLRSAAVRKAAGSVQCDVPVVRATSADGKPSGSSPNCCGRLRSTSAASGSTTAMAKTPATIVVDANPIREIPNSSAGAPRIPPALAPSDAIDTARP